MFRIETPRLVIRPWTPEDRPEMARITTNPEVMQYIHSGGLTDEQIDHNLARHARNLAEHGVCMGALVEKTSGRLVGIAGIQPLGTTPDFEIGWILERESWGKGYATEAGEAAMNHVLHTLARPRVVAIINPGNEPSKRVAGRIGMRYDARYTGAELGHRSPEIVVDLFYRERGVQALRE